MKTNGPELISFYMSVLKRSLITEFFRIFFLLRKSTTQNFFFKLVLEISNFPFVFFKKGKKEEKLGIQSPFFLFSQSFYSKCRFFLPLIPRDVISWAASSNYRITLSEIGKSYLRGLLLHLYLILKRNSRNSSSTTVCKSRSRKLFYLFKLLGTKLCKAIFIMKWIDDCFVNFQFLLTLRIQNIIKLCQCTVFENQWKSLIASI